MTSGALRTVGNAYYTLIGSLPALPRHLEDAERTPISRLRLDQRLRMLEPNDAETLEVLADFLAWDRQPLERTDEEVVARYEQMYPVVKNPTIWEIIASRLEVRTIVSGLRRRRRNEGPPPGVGDVATHIAARWKRPDFGLAPRYPWIATLDQLLADGAVSEAERLVMQVAWDRWNRMSDEHLFSFAAVILYLARLELVARWVGRDEDAGLQKFETLVTEAMGEYANLYQ